MTVAFSVEKQSRGSSWRAGDYFVSGGTLTGVVLGERDFKLMRLLFENKIVSREQIGSRFFPDVSKDTVNRRLRKIAGLGLIKRTTTAVGRKVIWATR